MKYKCFEELPVWQAAIEFALNIFEFTSLNYRSFYGLGDARNQLERAAISISNNVAEGFERGGTNELVNFLYIAKGSAGESRSVLLLCKRVPAFGDRQQKILALVEDARIISRQLNAWIDSIRASDLRGPKYRPTVTKLS